MYKNLDSQYQAGSVKTVTIGGIADHSNSYYRCVWGHGYNKVVATPLVLFCGYVGGHKGQWDL